MGIALYVADGHGGYGDLIFGLTAVHEIKKHLRKKGYADPIYLITGAAGKKKS